MKNDVLVNNRLMDKRHLALDIWKVYTLYVVCTPDNWAGGKPFTAAWTKESAEAIVHYWVRLHPESDEECTIHPIAVPALAFLGMEILNAK